MSGAGGEVQINKFLEEYGEWKEMTYVCTSTYSPLRQMFPFYFDLHIRTIR